MGFVQQQMTVFSYSYEIEDNSELVTESDCSDEEPVEFVTREEESGTRIPMNEAFSVRDDMQTNEFLVLADDNLTSESNGVHASESSSDCSCSSEGKDKTILMNARAEKKPDSIILKPPNASKCYSIF
ncbi:hypothetical protein Bca52824_022624 [Brassica carinata]|uniref:Uncharacterized protein n=1 Tax=Brassica carinata TaxID=52824 RepID=A0A8X8AUP1_BRACI|nr:hypothetical protein Bca52824_022624 [Brassica carinata]